MLIWNLQGLNLSHMMISSHICNKWHSEYLLEYLHFVFS